MVNNFPYIFFVLVMLLSRVTALQLRFSFAIRKDVYAQEWYENENYCYFTPPPPSLLGCVHCSEKQRVSAQLLLYNRRLTIRES
jgi:hypothetical protein